METVFFKMLFSMNVHLPHAAFRFLDRHVCSHGISRQAALNCAVDAQRILIHPSFH